MPIPSQPMLARRQLRLAVVAAIQSIQTAAGITDIESPGDWTTPPSKLPAVLVRNGPERKESIQKGMAEFTTTSSIEIEARLEATTSTAAQDGIEALGYLLENAVLTNYSVIGMVSQVASVDTQTEISSDGRKHLAGLKMMLNFEMPETYDPTAVAPALTTWPVVPAQLVPFTSFTLTGDLINIFDPNGTYVGTLFPNSVLPAPRTSGPDGRMEGGMDITLPQ